MKLYSQNEHYKLYNGNMLDLLEVIDKETIDAVLTDPPYELNFMSKGWDNAGVSFQADTWRKCYEVLKPGGYLLAFGGSRTFHRIACAIEDAGFEIRDTIMWLYGSGFPKSMSLSKGLEAREKLGNAGTRNKRKIEQSCDTETYTLKQTNNGAMGEIIETTRKQYIPNTDLAKQWQGWGTCLKPSFEPIIVARKPFKGSLVDNVLEYGVGGLNIDECRVEIDFNSNGREKYKNTIQKTSGIDFKGTKKETQQTPLYNNQGRFPANTILTYDETDFDEVCGGFPNTKTGSIKPHKNNANAIVNKMTSKSITSSFEGDSGSASRYFMNCKYTGKDEEIWKQLLVNNVESNLEILKATKDNIVQMNVEDLLKELKDHYAKYVDNQLDLIETPIVQDIVEISTWDFKIETSQVIQDFIINSKKCIQFLNLVQFVEKMDSIDTTQTTQNLLKLFGYVKVVITNYIVGNFIVNELDQKRYTYQPKASKKDRDEGLEEFEEKEVRVLNATNPELEQKDDVSARFITVKKNTHPTVKPTSLMQYLVRLVTPNNGTILDPFNGSGSTGKAVMYENRERNKNYKYIGIELTEEYLPIAKARIEYVCNLKEDKLKDMQMSIFDYLGDSNE